MKLCVAVLVLLGAYCWYEVTKLDRMADIEIKFIEEVHALLAAGLSKLGVRPAVVKRLITTYDVFDHHKHNRARAALWLPLRVFFPPLSVDVEALESWCKTIVSVVCFDSQSWPGEKRAQYCGQNANYIFGQRDLAKMQKLIWAKEGAVGGSGCFGAHECETDDMCREAYGGGGYAEMCADHWCMRGWCQCIHRD